MKDFCNRVRRHILDTSLRAGSVHFGGCFSVIEILADYYAPIINGLPFADFIGKNTLILSKGHCGLAVYAMLYELGVVSKEDFESYPKGRFIGHIKRDDSLGIGWSTGSLGHGLSVGMGIADGCEKKVTVILGDGELNEGQCWEAFMHLGIKRRPNLRVIVDNNAMMSLDRTENICPIEPLTEKLRAFRVPEVEVWNTVKGAGVSFMENKSHWHVRAITPEEYEEAIRQCAG